MNDAKNAVRIGTAVLVLAFASCGRSPKAPESQPKAVNAPPDSSFGEKPPAADPAGGGPSNPAGVEWLLVRIDGNDVPPGPRGAQARIRLDPATSEAAGLAVCNQFKGRFDLDEAGLRFGPLATTRKACRGEAMDLEAKYLKGLQDTSRWSMNGDRLILSDAAGRPLLEFAAHAGD
ncbi:MAG TPA: META domain-containing protein [Candidatus Polarisedimenticolia bacterium]|nr:META domain-containing protein [Candidatus Polarisedimenticolia bacterium]